MITILNYVFLVLVFICQLLLAVGLELNTLPRDSSAALIRDLPRVRQVAFTLFRYEYSDRRHPET